MNSVWRLAAAAVVCAAAARAQVKACHIPQSATAAVCVDVREIVGSPMGAFAQRLLDDNAKRGLSWLESACGINLTNDVDAFVAYTTGGLQTTGVVQIIYGRFDAAKLTALIGGAKDFQNKAVGERSLLCWTENGRRRYLCFVEPTMAALTWDEDALRQLVARADGGQPAGEGRFATLAARKKGRFVAAQVNSVAELAAKNPQLQVLKQAEALLLEVGQLAGANGLSLSLAVKAPTAEQAQQLQQAAQGLQALLMLQAGQNPEAAALAQGASVGLQERIVTVGLDVPEAALQKMVTIRIEQQRAAQEARRAARAERKKAELGVADKDDEGGAPEAKKPERPAF
jgi:hypothetical protein